MGFPGSREIRYPLIVLINFPLLYIVGPYDVSDDVHKLATD